MDAGKTGWRDPTGPLNIYLNYLIFSVMIGWYSMMDYIEILNAMVWLEIIGYDELLKIYKFDFGNENKRSEIASKIIIE